MSQLRINSLLKFGLASTAIGLVSGCQTLGVEKTQSESVSTEVSKIQVAQELSKFDLQMQALETSLAKRMEKGVPVPVPVDAGGGVVHEQHKANGKTIYEAGMLYQANGDAKYRDFARDILLDYAELYPTLGLHPEHKKSTAGRLFWQGLNEAVWLVYVIQGYETFRDELGEEERSKIEEGVLNPMADFLSEGSPQTFDRIHNHGTWAAAAVGMTGYVLGQQERVEKSLYGLKQDGEAGFLKQLDLLFSPDGYYAEGPYYQRYALMPFVLFSQAIEKNEPERKIFEYRDEIVLKAITSTVQQSYAGRFFPINDAIREKGLNTVELKYGLAIAYDLTKDPTLLGAVQLQKDVVPTPEGRALFDDIEAGKAKPFKFQSQMFRDGASGEEGALLVLRSGERIDDAAAVMKATTQGLGHGHFDKLGMLYYDNGYEVVADYGAVRFHNIVSKFGGRYLPENNSWAKASIAHNTLVVDEENHYGGDWRHSQKFSPEVLFFGKINGAQVTAAEVDTAYEGVNLQRVFVMVPRGEGEQPYFIDIMRGMSEEGHQYDLPVHYKGDLIETSFPVSFETESISALGGANGYQHLWRSGASEELSGMQDVSLRLGDSFQTLTFASDAPFLAVFTELGANDPDNNLRPDQGMVLRTVSDSVSFVSVYERNGYYDFDDEVAEFEGSSIESIEISNIDHAAVFKISTESGETITVLIADDTSAEANHKIVLSGQEIEWNGAVHVLR